MALSKEAPFEYLVGSSGQPRWDSTLLGFSTFYMRLANGSSVDEAVTAMKAATLHHEFRGAEYESARLGHRLKRAFASKPEGAAGLLRAFTDKPRR